MSIFSKKKYKLNDYEINRRGSVVSALNDDLHVDERRYINQIKVTAGGILLMGIWVFIKTFMDIIDEVRTEMVKEYGSGIETIIAGIVVIIVIAVILLIADLSLRYFLWRGAVIETVSGKKKNAYIVCAVLLMLYGAYAIGSFFYNLYKDRTAQSDDVIKLIFDVTSFILLWETLRAVFNLRKTREKLNNTDNETELQKGVLL